MLLRSCDPQTQVTREDTIWAGRDAQRGNLSGPLIRRKSASWWAVFFWCVAMKLELNSEELRPLIQAVVKETLTQVESDRAKLDDKLAYSEQEAARMLGLDYHVLRDERLRGRIKASQIVGRRIRYTQADLLEYLAERRIAQ